MFIRARARLSRGGVELLDAHRDFECLTSVMRLPPDIAAQVATLAGALPGAAGHYLYPLGDLHLTVLNLDTARLPINELQAATARTLRSAERFPIRLRGFGMTRHSVYAQAWDSTGALWRLRGRLAAATGCRDTPSRRLLGFVNVIRFMNPDVTELRAGVCGLHRLDIGAFDAQEVEIVRTNKVLATAATTVLQKYRLA